ncbi:unnamed protein product [Fraxinus pennsylvanica]|uniref:Uncharacterized protein n=1 Tax=Fraxinus pennsylvanica TaxID=56036 RepID=A0AAD1ZU25_9LAMI|nr:unnamed protein product [Fraxinus pennsylvanica]
MTFSSISGQNSKVHIEKFIVNLMSAYTTHIEVMLDDRLCTTLGIRKFGIISAAPVGRYPAQRLVQKILTGKDGCFEAMNDIALAFHIALSKSQEVFILGFVPPDSENYSSGS